MAEDEGRGGGDARADLELPSLRSAFRRRSARSEASPKRPRRRRTVHDRRLPPGWLAAVVTGALVGLALVGLTSAGLHACTAMRGTTSCGTPGILLLLVITALAVLLGSLVLALAGVARHGSTSLLGVGLLVVLILLALIPVLDDRWVVVIVPAVGAVAFLAAWWLTTTYTDPGGRGGPDDVA